MILVAGGFQVLIRFLLTELPLSTYFVVHRTFSMCFGAFFLYWFYVRNVVDMGQAAKHGDPSTAMESGSTHGVAYPISTRWIAFIVVLVASLSVALPYVHFPLLAIFPSIGGVWLKWVNYSLAVRGFGLAAEISERAAVTRYMPETAIYFAIAMWIVFGLVYAYLMRQVSIASTARWAFPVSVVWTFILVNFFNAFGLFIYPWP